jgi:membrane protease YdiL (CAAX protease family)
MSDAPTTTADTLHPPSDSQAVAPAWHTAGVLLLLLGLVVLGLFARSAVAAGHASHRALGYSITIAAEWLIVGFIALGSRWGGASFRTLAGKIAPNWRSILRDLGLAAAYLVVANIVLGVLSALLARILGPSQGGSLNNLLPHGALENGIFLLLALTAGICEETIFRGYLQRQFMAWTRNAAAGIVLQGVVFGAAHAYQGLNQVIIIAVYGCMFGLLALWRKSLRPGMIAHFAQDAIGGLVLARYLVK